jgi:hypothetical protein
MVIERQRVEVKEISKIRQRGLRMARWLVIVNRRVKSEEERCEIWSGAVSWGTSTGNIGRPSGGVGERLGEEVVGDPDSKEKRKEEIVIAMKSQKRKRKRRRRIH